MGNDTVSNSTNEFSCLSNKNILGGQRVWEVSITAIGTTIWSIITTGGNLLVIISFVVNKKLRIVTNYFIVSLATADFLIGMITINLYSLYVIMNCWPLGDIVCNLWLVMDYGCCQASVISLVLVCMDRYFSISRPKAYSIWRTKKMANFAIILAWMLAMLIWVPLIYIYPLATNKTLGKGECIALFLFSSPVATLLTHILGYFLPVIIIAVQYKRMYSVIREKEKSLKMVQFASRDFTIKDEAITVSQTDSTVNESPSDGSLKDRSEGKSKYNNVSSSNKEIRKNFDQIGIVKDNNNGIDSQLQGVQFGESSSQHEKVNINQGSKGDLAATLSEGSILTNRSFETSNSNGKYSKVSLIEAQEDTNRTGSRFHGNHIAITEGKEVNVKEMEVDGKENPEEIHTAGGDGPQQRIPSIKEVKSFDSQHFEPQILVNQHVSKDITFGKREEKKRVGKKNVKFNSVVPSSETVNQALKTTTRKNYESLVKHKRVARMIFLVVISYVVFWLPYELFAMMKPFCSHCIPDALWSFSYGFAYVNSTVNPLCYTLANKKFRNTFKRIICCRRRGTDEELIFTTEGVQLKKT